MTRVDFLTQARIDDEAFVKALAERRMLKRQINMEYSQLRREISSSMKNCGPSLRTRTHETPSLHSRYRSRSVASSTRPMTSSTVRRLREDDASDVFLVKKVRVRAKRPLTGVSPQRKSANLPQLVSTQRSARRMDRNRR